MKKLLVLLPLLLLTACASTPNDANKEDGPVSAQPDLPRKDKITGVFNFGSLFKESEKKQVKRDAKLKAENDELRARIERLENNLSGNNNATITTSTNNKSVTSSDNDNDSVSFREWSKAREKGSNEYDEFQEYQNWLEFKKYKAQQE